MNGRRWRHAFTAGIALALVLGACSGGGPLARNPRTPEVPSSGFQTLWETDLDALGVTLRENWRGSLVGVSGETVILTGADGTTVGVDLRTGSELWSTALLPVPMDKVVDPPTDSRVTPDPQTGYDDVIAPAFGTVYVTSSSASNWTVALDPATGEILWAEVGFAPVIGPDFPYLFLSGEEQMHRVGPKTLETLWSKAPNAFASAIADDLLVGVAHGSEEHFYGVDPQPVTARSVKTGDMVWQTDGPTSPTDIVAEAEAGLAITLDEDGRLLALDTATGARGWESSELVVSVDGQPLDAQPRLLGTNRRSLFVGVQDRGAAVVAISLTDGSRRWRVDLPWQRKPLGSVENDRVLVTTPDYFQVLDPADGAVEASRGDLAGTAVMHGDIVCAVVREQEKNALSCMELT